MTIARIYQAIPLSIHSVITLDAGASHHLASVLRANINDKITLFNGEGGEFAGIIAAIEKKKVTVKIEAYHPRVAESPLEICLAQGISRGEKMDFTIQKAVELGVSQIVPLFTERCNVKLDADRSQKRVEHWQSIIISASEQSGRNILAKLEPPQMLTRWIGSVQMDQGFVLAPTSEQKLNSFSLQKKARVILLIGPEGGLSENEIKLAVQKNFAPLNLGPRILRTETAGIAAITALQCYFGDMTN
ncbi:MAG: 16S rRNA (uracil(1498)-N(3))-methyltransferase [Gammaproteobacteria bacterium]|nr:16S rRNA (uracil(1498)-N(3))-methyltransferase [Gammaproteobacteria bacterium]